jgi:hypothetical protein
MTNTNRSWSAPIPPVLWWRHTCPRCNSAEFKQAELRSYDPLLALLGLHPVRCKFCWRRYYYWFTLSGVAA